MAIGLYKTKEEEQPANWWGNEELPGPRAGKEPESTAPQQKERQVKVPEQSIDRNMPKDQAHLPVDNMRDRVRDAGMFKGKPEDNGIKAPEMKYNPDDYLPEKSWMKDAPFDTPDKTQVKQPQPQEQASTEQPTEQTSRKQDEYAIDPSDSLGSIFDIEVSSSPEYDEKRQKVRKNQAVLGTLGNALTSMGDGLTLGMGGYVVDRNFDDNEKYINDFLGYRDDYQKRLADWDNQRFLQELRKAGEITDKEYKDEANRIKEKQGDRDLDLRERNYEEGWKDRDYSNETSRKGVESIDNYRRKQLEMQQKKLADQLGETPVEYTVNTPTGTAIKELSPNQAQENFVSAMSNPEFMKWAAETGLVQKDTKGGGTDDFGRPIEGETNYSIERGIKPLDIAIAFDKYRTSQRTGSDINWTGVDYQTANKPLPKKEETIGSEMVGKVIGRTQEGNKDTNAYVVDRIMNSNNDRFKTNNVPQAIESFHKQLTGEGLSEEVSRSFIEAMKNGDVSSIVNLDDTDREQMGRMLQRTDQQPERVQAAIETLLIAKGFTPSQSEVIAMDFMQKGLPESTQLPSEEERLNVLP